MSFKIKSTVSIHEYLPEGSSSRNIEHVVLSREKLLRPGKIIHVKGSISRDEEAKNWEFADGKIRIIDSETLGICWRLRNTLMSTISGPEMSEARELWHWEPERIIKGNRLELEDNYHSEPEFQEIFTLADKLHIGLLTEKMLHKLKGIKDVYRKTKLVYEL